MISFQAAVKMDKGIGTVIVDTYDMYVHNVTMLRPVNVDQAFGQ